MRFAGFSTSSLRLGKKILGAFCVYSLVSFFLSGSVIAATGSPFVIHHQGRLLDSSGSLLGGSGGTDFCFRFSLYNAISGGTKLWPTGTPSAMTVDVKNGIFDVGIGDVSAGGDLLDYPFQESDTVYLNVQVAAQVSGSCVGASFETLSPRHRILSSPYALNANTVGGFLPSQAPSGENIPVLSGGNLTLAGTDPGVSASGANALVLQGDSTGNINFFSALNTLTASGALTLAGDITANGLTISGGTISLPAASIENADLQNSSLSVVAGSGLLNGGTISLGGSATLNIGAGNGIAVAADAVSVSLLSTPDGTGGASSASGLEFQGAGTNELALLQGCANGQVLKWSEGSSLWQCANDASGGGSGTLQDAYDNGTTITLGADNVLLELADDTSDAALVLDNTSTGDVAVALTITTSGSGATIATALDLSDAGIGTALALGSNDVTVGGATISASEFAVLDGGVTYAEITDTGTLTVTTVDIKGGTIDDTAIGASSPSTGAFTTLGSTGATTLGNNSSTVAINSSSWDIATSGTATGLTISTASNTITGIASANITDGSVANADLANSSVTVTAGTGLSGGGAVSLGGSVSLASTLGVAIDSSEITDGTIALIDLASGSVNSATIVDGTIVLADLASGSVDSSKIVDGSVALADLATDSVDSGIIVDGSVANADLANSSVTVTAGTGLSGGGAVSLGGSVSLASTLGVAIDSSEITDNAITASDLASVLTFADSDLIDLSAINLSSATEGLLLPQAADVSAATATGQIAWDADDHVLYVGTGSGVVAISNPFGSSIDASEITDGTITGTDVQNGSIANADLVNSSVTVTAGTGLSGGGAVSLGGSVSLASTLGVSIDSSEIVDGTVVLADLAANAVESTTIVDGSVANADLASDAVGSANIINASIALADLATGSVNSAKIVDGSIALADLAGDSVNSGIIVDGSVANADLANSSVTVTAGTGLSGGGAVSLGGSVSLASTLGVAIDSSEITDGTIALIDLASGSVNSSKIVDGSVALADLATDSVDSGIIVDGSVANADLANSSVTVTAGTGLSGGGAVSLGGSVSLASTLGTSIDSSEIVDGTVSGTDIENDSVVLGTDTSGNYIATLTAGGGLTGSASSEGATPTVAVVSANGAIAVNADDIALTLAPSANGLSSSTSSGSGLEILSTGLALLQGCADGQVLKWDETADVWQCANDASGGGSGTLQDAYDNGTTITLGADNVLLELADDTSDAALVLDNTSTGDVAVALTITTSGSGATIATALDLSDAGIGTALALGSNDVTVGGATLSASELAILDSGLSYGELTDTGTLTVTTVDINGGAIDGTAIGASSPSTGAFTTLSSTGATTLGNNSATVAINSNSWDIATGGTVSGITLDAGSNTLTGIASANITDGSVANADLANSSVTVTAGTGLSGGGAVSLGGSVSLASTLGVAIDTSEITDGTITNADLANNTLDFDKIADALTLDAATSMTGLAGKTITFARTLTDATAENAFTLNVTAQDTGAGTSAQFGLYVDNLASTEGLDASLVLANADADDAVGAAIKIVNAGGNFTNVFDNEGTLISGTELNRLDGKDAALIDTNDAVSSALTGTGALNAGSITSGFGAIDVGADAITTSGTVSGNAFDRSSAGALSFGNTNATSVTIGGSSVTAFTVTTDGTGNAEVVLPTGSISGTEILDDSVTLTTDTNGNYVASITNGSGITGGDGGTEGAGLTLAINLATSGTTGSTSSNSGLEVGAGGLALLKGCTDGYTLRWTDAGGWACASETWDNIVDAEANGAIAFGSTTQTMDWGVMDANASYFSFNFTNAGTSAGTDSGLVINNAANGSSSTDTNTENLLLIQQLDTTAGDAKVVDNGLKIDVAANAGMVDGIEITNSAGNLTGSGLNIVDTAGGTFAAGITLSGTFTTGIDAGSSIITNIGNAATDFDTNGGLTLASDATLNAQADIRFADADSSNWVAFQAPTSVSSNVTWTLPSTDATGCFESNGSGVISITACGDTRAEVFTSNGTYTKPNDALLVIVEGVGAGGGGAGGSGGAITSVRAGGGGGGGGAYVTNTFVSSDIVSSVTVTVPSTGGAGGNAGLAGTLGGNASFGTLLVAYGGGGGGVTTSTGGGGGGGAGQGSAGSSTTIATGANGGGPAGSSGAGGTGSTTTSDASGVGGAGGADSANTTARNGGSGYVGGGGGGASTVNGGGNSGGGGGSLKGGGGGGAGASAPVTTFVARNGGAGGASNSSVNSGGSAGGTGGVTGGAGTVGGLGSSGYGGGGGGGGGNSSNAAGGAGGAGGTPGGGGGGGGAGNPTAGGAGGTGGRGEIRVWTLQGAGADLAEIYSSHDETLTAGDVVSIDPSLHSGVRKSGSSYDEQAIGIISTKPGLVLGDAVEASAHPVLVALSGRVPVKVSLENGPIVPGDYLTPSSTPGIAMKATKAGLVIGQALTAYDGTMPQGFVVAFIKNGHANGLKLAQMIPGLRMEGEVALQDALVEGEQISSPRDVGALALDYFLESKETLEAAQDVSEILADRVSAGLEVITPHLIADEVSTNTIAAGSSGDVSVRLLEDGAFVVQDALHEEHVRISDTGDALFGGTLTAHAIQLAGEGGTEDLSATLARLLAATDGLEAKVTSVEARATFLEEAQQQDEANMERLLARLDVLAAPSPIDFADLSLQGSLTVSGLATFGGVRLDTIGAVGHAMTFLNDLIFIGRPYVNDDTAGFALIRAGDDRVRVAFQTPYLAQPIVHADVTFDAAETAGLEPEEVARVSAKRREERDAYLNSTIRFVVVEKNTEGFTILLNQPTTEDLPFSWVALAALHPRLVQSTPEPPPEDRQEDVPEEDLFAPTPAPETPPPAETDPPSEDISDTPSPPTSEEEGGEESGPVSEPSEEPPPDAGEETPSIEETVPEPPSEAPAEAPAEAPPSVPDEAAS